MKAADLDEAVAALPPGWEKVVPEWTAARGREVAATVRAVSGDRPIAPEDPFRALRLLRPDDVRVVVIGQDPYPTAGHADGLAFSSPLGRPRSLARVFERLAEARPGFVPPRSSSLDDWARRGVLLLNPVLTVEIGRSGSHENVGWQALTQQIVRYLSERRLPPTFLLWGARAKTFAARSMAHASQAPVLATRHPSYDFARLFMAEGNHFAATAHLVDWWEIGGRRTRVL